MLVWLVWGSGWTVDMPETNKYKEQVQTTARAACSGEGMQPKPWQLIS